jgi:FkbM family methyltransferase
MTNVFDAGLALYRKTFKRLRPVHLTLHRAMTGGAIPLLERAQGFQTMPDDPFWFRLELLIGRHERETVAQVERLVGPGMVVLDVGAHVGYYARRCARLVGERGRVIAFEPHPRTFAVLTANLRAHPNVTPLQLAAAEGEGSAELFDYLMMSASGSLHYDESLRDLQKAQVTTSDVAPRLASDFPMEQFTVRTRAVDAVLDELGIATVDLIKMDIEGAEINALRGLRATIARSPRLALIMEYNPQALKAFGHAPEAAIAEVLALGFSGVQRIEADGATRPLSPDQLADLTSRLMGHMDVVNLLFVR